LNILTQNLRKLCKAQLDLLNKPETNDYHILCLQEPHINNFIKTSLTNCFWDIIYPTNRKTKLNKPYQSIILI
ncbi:hypothetical protein DL96DRAFT_1413922, partial [Flagelloscypha sp. PMI_526]